MSIILHFGKIAEKTEYTVYHIQFCYKNPAAVELQSYSVALRSRHERALCIIRNIGSCSSVTPAEISQLQPELACRLPRTLGQPFYYQFSSFY